MRADCESCESKNAELARLRAQNEDLLAQLREVEKQCTLLEGELERYEALFKQSQPNRPEHVAPGQLQLAFEQVIASFAGAQPANDAGAEASADPSKPEPSTPPSPPSKPENKPPSKPHGRRRLDASKLPVHEEVIIPDEVRAAGGRGFIRIGEEVSERIAFRPASFILLRTILARFARVPALVEASSAPIVQASVPPNLWPRVMGDVSAIVEIILAKYDMSLPLHRQQRVSPRHGFYLPRSTQCDWLALAYGYLYRIVDAMMVEACAKAFCIGTDATGAPVRMPGACASWHVFVFIADRDHVIFRASAEHTGDAITLLLQGFRGFLLSDAASIYDVLHREHGMTAVYCWAHVRRYFWNCRDTHPSLAMEALAIIAQLFDVERTTKSLPMPERTAERARQATPVLTLFDQWVERVRPKLEPRTPLQAAITYYDNQREGLRRFLDDGRLPIDNNGCERELRSLVVGLHNWNFFENPAGLRWYSTFRSLIASCALHGLEPQHYLDEILRLAPHWPTTRLLELSPKYWPATRASLSKEHRAALRSPFETTTHRAADSPPRADKPPDLVPERAA